MADIVIRGMKMPKDHPINVFIWPDGRVFPYGLYKSNEWDGVKAIPLPEDYGRLIDANKLTPDMGNYITGGGSGTVGSMCTMLGYSQQNIDNATTILEAERR